MFPSVSTESYGRFVGISEHVGHALTFLVIAEDSQRLLHRSVVQTALDPASRNMRAEGLTNDNPPKIVQSCLDDKIESQHKIYGNYNFCPGQENQKGKIHGNYNFCPNQENHKGKSYRNYKFCSKQENHQSKNYGNFNF